MIMEDWVFLMTLLITAAVGFMAGGLFFYFWENRPIRVRRTPYISYNKEY